jgi:hypothetical protein
MNLHELLKLKCKIYYDGNSFIGTTCDVFSDTFKELRTYPIETFKDYPFSTQIKLNKYYNRVLNLTDLKDQLESISGFNLACKNRKQEINFVRQVFCVKARRMGYPFSAIAGLIKRDHATAIHGINQFINLHKDKMVREYYLRYMSEEEITEIVDYLKGKANLRKKELENV